MEEIRLVSDRSIASQLAVTMMEEGLKAAKSLGIKGFLIICARDGRQLCSVMVGDVKPANIMIAMAKVGTVISCQQSTRVRAESIMEKHYRPEDFAGAVETMFGGGLAVFSDKECKEFVGAIAFSGGEQWQDIHVCREAVVEVGMFTDEPLVSSIK